MKMKKMKLTIAALGFSLLFNIFNILGSVFPADPGIETYDIVQETNIF